MSYPNLNSPVFDKQIIEDFLSEIQSRKEFNNYNYNNNSDTNVIIEPVGFRNISVKNKFLMPGIHLSPAQHFIKNFQSPNTMYKRILIEWATGAGKGKAAGAIGKGFIDNFKERRMLGEIVPYIYVISFTHEIIQDELLKDASFGFATTEEYEEVQRLKNDVNTNPGNQGIMQEYVSRLSVLRRRITDKGRNGFYNFYGYKQFANNLFILTDLSARNKFNIL